MGLGTLNNAITLVSRIVDTHQAVHPMYPDTAEKPPLRFSAIRQPFPRVKPEEAGVSSAHIAAFLHEIAHDETLNMHSILILRDGKMLAEAAFGASDLRCWKHTFSACKSVTSLAIGLLIAEGKLSLDARPVEILEGIPPLARHTARELTVQHLLTMTSGASFNEASMMTERDWIRGYFSGSFALGAFAYNSLNTYILSAILTQITGETLSEYLKPRLFDPLGISNYYWEKSPTGIDKGGWGLYIRPEDLAKLGQLVLQNGVWNGETVVPEDWISQAAHKQIATGAVSDAFDYGYQIWTGRTHDSFLFNGMLGQNVLGLRENGILLVSHAGNDELFQQSSYFSLVEKYFCRPFGSALPQDESKERTLQATLRAIAEQKPQKADEKPPKKTIFPLFAPRKAAVPPAPSPSALPPECSRLGGVRFDVCDDNAPGVGLMPVILQATQNNYAAGLHSLSFLCSGNSFYMTYTEADESYLLRIGLKTAADTDLTFHGVPYHVKTKGTFTTDEDGVPLLKLRIDFSETPLTRILKLYYTGASPTLEQSERPGAPFIFSKVLSIKQDLKTTPLIGETVNLLDDDYLRYRVDKKFRPTLRLTPSQIIPKLPAKK